MFKIVASVPLALLVFGTATAPNASADPLTSCTEIYVSVTAVTPPMQQSVWICPPA